MSNCSLSVSAFIDCLNDRLKQRDRFVEMLRAVGYVGVTDPEQILMRVLRERAVLVEHLAKSGAVEQVGAESISQHLSWLIPKFLRPVSWKTVNREKKLLEHRRARKGR